jgi:hypothetical protein
VVFTATVLLARRYVDAIESNSPNLASKYSRFLDFASKYGNRYEDGEGNEGKYGKDLPYLDSIGDDIDNYVQSTTYNSLSDEYKLLMIISSLNHMFKKMVAVLFRITAKAVSREYIDAMNKLPNNPIAKIKKAEIEGRMKDHVRDVEKTYRRHLTTFRKADTLSIDKNLIEYIENNHLDVK